MTCDKCGGECIGHEIFGRVFRVCPTCEAEQAEKDKKEFEARSVEEKQRDLERIQREIEAQGIGDRYAGLTFDDYKVTNPKQAGAVKIMRAIADRPADFQTSGKTVVLHGISGTGKTMLATILVQELIKQRKTVQYTTVLRMIRSIRQTFGNKDRDEQQAIDEYAKCSLLVLEEVGIKTATEYENSILFEILDDRYRYKLPTIITSNLDGKQLEAYFGERLWRRFKTQDAIILAFDWKE